MTHAFEGLGFATRALHAGLEAEAPHRPRATPIHLTAGFVFDDFDDGHARFAGAEGAYSYTRVANPTNAAAEHRIAALESGAGALLVGSGQAALATTLLGLLSAGDHIVAASALYEGSREFIRSDLQRLGITSALVDDLHDPDAWERAIRPETKVLFAESIANPRNEVLDIAAVAAVAHRHGIPLVVDSTLATPALLRPIEHGADLVIHSASKFLAGHGTVLGGFVVDAGRFAWTAERYPQLAAERGVDGLTTLERQGPLAFLEHARRVAMRFGPSPSPLNAFLIVQGIETLALRVQRQSSSALTIARWLATHPLVASVDYSGLESSPDHERARRYLPDGQGSVFAVTVRGGIDGARAVNNALRLFTSMTHLGDVRSLVLHPATTTHLLRDEASLRRSGIEGGTLRLSIGLEDPDDLVADLDRALRLADSALELASARLTVSAA